MQKVQSERFRRLQGGVRREWMVVCRMTLEIKGRKKVKADTGIYKYAYKFRRILISGRS